MQATAPALVLTSQEAADALKISARHLWQLTAPRGPIRSTRIGGSVRYTQAELERYIASETEQCHAQK